MNSRELARNYFKECNLTYDDIGMNEIYKLIQILNRRIEQADSCMLMMNEPKLKGRYRNIILKDDKIKFAELKVKGTYFNDREAITFNDDGYIGFCGWADGCNLTPFVMGFKEWCDYLKNKKPGVSND